MYQFRAKSTTGFGTILGCQPAHVFVQNRGGGKALQGLWGGTIEAALARSIKSARSVRLEIGEIRSGTSDWIKLADWQYVQGCLFPLEPYPVVFVVTERGVPRIIALPR